MSFAETVLMGAIAGFTIYIGLPLGRVKRVDDQIRVALAMFSVGILAFIFMDVTKHGQQIVLPRARSIAGIVLWLGCFLTGAEARKRARARAYTDRRKLRTSFQRRSS